MQENASETENLVSVIIPTRDRPDLLPRAISSVLLQSHEHLQVIVISDGPSPANKAIVIGFGDKRLDYHELPEPLGASAARNAGILVAKGNWIALLDDDDEWHSEKIEKQLAAAIACDYKYPLILSRFIFSNGIENLTWPINLPHEKQTLGNYIFERKRAFRGESAALTSTFFCHRHLLDEIQFDELSLYHQDLQWLLEIERLEGFGCVYLEEPLAYWHTDPERARLSFAGAWKDTYHWGRSIRHLLSREAYAGFLSSMLAARASGHMRALPVISRELWTSKGFTLKHWLLLLALLLLPANFRTFLRRIFSKIRRAVNCLYLPRITQ